MLSAIFEQMIFFSSFLRNANDNAKSNAFFFPAA
jgi:hypothetical protein